MVRFLAKCAVLFALVAVPFALDSEPVGAQSAGQCDPNYRPCIRNTSGDALNCPDIPGVTVRVIGVDHNNFDADDDGIGCEVNGGTAPSVPAASGTTVGFTVDIPTAAPTPPAAPVEEQPPANALATVRAPQAAAPICDPNYQPCIPNTTGDALDCSQIAFVVTVVGVDHNRFDTDGDGIGCEVDVAAAPVEAAPPTESAPAAEAIPTAPPFMTPPPLPPEPATPPPPPPPATQLATTGPESARVLAGFWLVGSGVTLLGLRNATRRRHD